METILLILAGLFTVLVLTLGLIKACSKRRYLTAQPPSHFTNDVEDEDEVNSAFDVYIDKDKSK